MGDLARAAGTSRVHTQSSQTSCPHLIWVLAVRTAPCSDRWVPRVVGRGPFLSPLIGTSFIAARVSSWLDRAISRRYSSKCCSYQACDDCGLLLRIPRFDGRGSSSAAAFLSSPESAARRVWSSASGRSRFACSSSFMRPGVRTVSASTIVDLVIRISSASSLQVAATVRRSPVRIRLVERSAQVPSISQRRLILSHVRIVCRSVPVPHIRSIRRCCCCCFRCRASFGGGAVRGTATSGPTCTGHF